MLREERATWRESVIDRSSLWVNPMTLRTKAAMEMISSRQTHKSWRIGGSTGNMMVFIILHPWLLALCISGVISVEGMVTSSSPSWAGLLLFLQQQQERRISQQLFFFFSSSCSSGARGSSSSVNFDVLAATCLTAFVARDSFIGGMVSWWPGDEKVKDLSLKFQSRNTGLEIEYYRYTVLYLLFNLSLWL